MSHIAAVASSGQGPTRLSVGAVNQLLLTQVYQIVLRCFVELDEQLGFNGSSGGKGVAAAAAALVLGGGHFAKLSPVPTALRRPALGTDQLIGLGRRHPHLDVVPTIGSMAKGTRCRSVRSCNLVGKAGKAVQLDRLHVGLPA